MSEWKECKLGDVAVFNYGKSLKTEHRIQGNIPVFSSAGLSGWHNQALANSSCIIVGRKGTIGKVYYCDKPFWCIDTAYYILPNEDKYNLKFLYYLLPTLGLDELNEDSAVPGLNRDTAYSQLLNLPPLPEQKAIAAVLSSLDDKIDLLHRQNKTLEAMAETLFRQWFVEGAEEDWEEKPLGESVSVIDSRGKTPPCEENYSPYPVIEVNALGKTDRLVDYSVIKKYVNEETFNNWFRGKLNKYDTLISTVGSIGALSMYVIEKGNIAQNVIGLHAEVVSPFYVYQLLKYKLDEIMQYDIGGVQPSIKVPHLLSIQIQIPPKERQNNFDESMITIVNKMGNNYLQIRTLENLRNTLLPKLMSGEVRVGA